jgi:hypothetical protein
MNVKLIAKAAERFVVNNSTGILTGLGVAGAVTSAVLTGRAAFRVGLDASTQFHEEISLSGEPDDELLSNAHLVKTYWKEFIPSAVVLAGTATCIIAANSIGARRTAAITAAFKLSEELAEGYKKKVVETLGKQKEEKMRSELAAERIEKNGGVGTIIVVGSEVLFEDALSGRVFKQEYARVEKAVNEINHQVNNFYHASLTEFYEKIGLSGTIFSDEVGWNSDQLLEVKYTPTIVDDKPAISIEFRTAPVRGFDRCM